MKARKTGARVSRLRAPDLRLRTLPPRNSSRNYALRKELRLRGRILLVRGLLGEVGENAERNAEMVFGRSSSSPFTSSPCAR